MLQLWLAAPEGLGPVVASELDDIAAGLGLPLPRAVDAADGGLRLAWPAGALVALCQLVRTAEALLVDVGQVPLQRESDVTALVARLTAQGWLPACGVGVRVHAKQGAASRARWLQTAAEQALDATGQLDGHAQADGHPRSDSSPTSMPFSKPNSRPDSSPLTVLHLRAGRGDVGVALDPVGGALHRRGYRLEPGAAPLRETVAAALLRWAGWQGHGAIWDPCCGSGTLLIEAALHGQALLQLPLACSTWPGLPAQQAVPATNATVCGEGGDLDPAAVAIARRNAGRAGVDLRLRLEARELGQWRDPPPAAAGLVVSNLPWGARLGQRAEARRTAERWAAVVRRRTPGWRVALAVPEPQWAAALGLQDVASVRTRNGGKAIWLVRGRVADRP